MVIILSDNDMSRAYHALVVAITARQLGYSVALFVTGLGVALFGEKPRTRLVGLPLLARIYIRWALRRIGARRLEELVNSLTTHGVEVYVDEPALRMLGVKPRGDVRIAGSMTFIAKAEEADLLLTF